MMFLGLLAISFFVGYQNGVDEYNSTVRYLTGAEYFYSLKKSVREGEENILSINFTKQDTSRNFDWQVLLEDGSEISLINETSYCGPVNDGEITCHLEYLLPTDNAGKIDLTLAYTYDDGVEIIPRSDVITYSVTPKPFTPPTPPPSPVVSVNQDDATANQNTFIEEVRNEMLNRGIKEAQNTQSEFNENIARASQTLEIEKETRFNETANKTKTTITIYPPKGGIAHNVSIIEYIPKEVAEHVSDLVIFTSGYEVINDDPLIMWHFSAVDERIDISYEAKGNVEVTGNTIVAAESIEGSGTAWHIILPMLLIPLLIIALIGIPRMMHKKK